MQQNESNRSRVLRAWPRATAVHDTKAGVTLIETANPAEGHATMTLGLGKTERAAWRHARRQVDRDAPTVAKVVSDLTGKYGDTIKFIAVDECVNIPESSLLA